MPGPKTSKWTWDDLQGFKDLPVGDLDFIRRTLLAVRAAANLENPLQTFWSMVLAPYYSMQGVINREALFVLYRLSDQLPVETRKSLPIYPNGDAPWHTLEDWRQEFVSTLKNGEDDIFIYIGTAPELPSL